MYKTEKHDLRYVKDEVHIQKFLKNFSYFS